MEHPSILQAESHLSQHITSFTPSQHTSSSSSPAPTHKFSTDLPRAPRIVIPPPVPTTFTPHPALPKPRPTSTNPPESLLLTLTTHFPTSEWRYESRRTAQQILPHLFLGPLAPARDLAFLRTHGITQAIGLRSFKTANILNMRVATAPDWPVHQEVVDVGRSFNDMISAFKTVKTLIDKHFLAHQSAPTDSNLPMSDILISTALNTHAQQQSGKTLLYCESGNERSAAVAVAYLMGTFGVGTVSAVQFVQAKRFCISFSEEVKGLLVTYEGLLRAERECNVGKEFNVGNEGGQGRKRGNGEVYEDEEEEMGRDGVAPYGGDSQQSFGDVEMEL